jgi:hypothetical protein
MTTKWYYVEDNERVGPIEKYEMKKLLVNGFLNDDSYVWKKGFDNWLKVSDIPELEELKNEPEESEVETDLELPPVFDKSPPQAEMSWDEIDFDERLFMIKVGRDRGGNETEYGPFSLNMIKKLFDEKRINGKTLIFTRGMTNWAFVADIPVYNKLFESLPPVIEDEERRTGIRKPFVARMFFHDNQEAFEGICRDISVGGLQILVSNFPVKLGETISINVHPDNGDYSFVAAGEVVRVLEGDQGFSLRFNELNRLAENTIQSYIQSS